jgi:hypothetical protein
MARRVESAQPIITVKFGTPRLHLGFALGGGTIFANGLPSLTPSNIELRPNEVRSCTVINAVGREMFLKKEGTPTSSSSHIFATAKLSDRGKSLLLVRVVIS